MRRLLPLALALLLTIVLLVWNLPPASADDGLTLEHVAFSGIVHDVVPGGVLVDTVAGGTLVPVPGASMKVGGMIVSPRALVVGKPVTVLLPRTRARLIAVTGGQAVVMLPRGPLGIPLAALSQSRVPASVSVMQPSGRTTRLPFYQAVRMQQQGALVPATLPNGLPGMPDRNMFGVIIGRVGNEYLLQTAENEAITLRAVPLDVAGDLQGMAGKAVYLMPTGGALTTQDWVPGRNARITFSGIVQKVTKDGVYLTTPGGTVLVPRQGVTFHPLPAPVARQARSGNRNARPASPASFSSNGYPNGGFHATQPHSGFLPGPYAQASPPDPWALPAPYPDLVAPPAGGYESGNVYAPPPYTGSVPDFGYGSYRPGYYDPGGANGYPTAYGGYPVPDGYGGYSPSNGYPTAYGGYPVPDGDGGYSPSNGYPTAYGGYPVPDGYGGYSPSKGYPTAYGGYPVPDGYGGYSPSNGYPTAYGNGYDNGYSQVPRGYDGQATSNPTVGSAVRVGISILGMVLQGLVGRTAVLNGPAGYYSVPVQALPAWYNDSPVGVPFNNQYNEVPLQALLNLVNPSYSGYNAYGTNHTYSDMALYPTMPANLADIPTLVNLPNGDTVWVPLSRAMKLQQVRNGIIVSQPDLPAGAADYQVGVAMPNGNVVPMSLPTALAYQRAQRFNFVDSERLPDSAESVRVQVRQADGTILNVPLATALNMQRTQDATILENPTLPIELAQRKVRIRLANGTVERMGLQDALALQQQQGTVPGRDQFVMAHGPRTRLGVRLDNGRVVDVPASTALRLQHIGAGTVVSTLAVNEATPPDRHARAVAMGRIGDRNLYQTIDKNGRVSLRTVPSERVAASDGSTPSPGQIVTFEPSRGRFTVVPTPARTVTVDTGVVSPPQRTPLSRIPQDGLPRVPRVTATSGPRPGHDLTARPP